MRMNAMYRERDERNGVIQAWKDDYIFLLQSCITVPNADVIDGWLIKLFGGDTVCFCDAKSYNCFISLAAG